MKRLLSALLGLLLLVAPVTAGERFRIVVNGAAALGGPSYAELRSFTEFAETGRLDTSYSAATGTGVEIGFEYRFVKHLGLQAAFHRISRNTEGRFQASFPHPFFFDRQRQASGEAELGYDEGAFHLDLVYAAAAGAWRFVAFGGASFFSIEADLVDRLDYAHSYPYDSVSVTRVVSSAITDDPLGFNLGGGVDLMIGPRFALGAQVRFSRARAELRPAGGGSVAIDVGGTQLAAGARLSF